jgi:hypothetical protein
MMRHGSGSAGDTVWPSRCTGAALTLAPGCSVAATLRIVPVAKNCDAVAVRGLTVRAPGTAATATLPRTGKACSGKIAKPQLVVTPVAAL